jgi:hypothetical protein
MSLFNSVSAELKSSNFGILCLTRENLTAPWIHFEAGGISNLVEYSRVAPMLFKLQPSDIAGPLTQFQAKTFDKDGIHDLLKSINQAAGEEALDTTKAHPAVPGWPICSMGVPCAGDQRRAGGDIGWLGRDR